MATTAERKVALITGGASGMGLAVAKALVERGGWHVHLIDRNPEAGASAVKDLGSAATFHEVNVTIYEQLATAFKKVFEEEHRLDMVWANAGIVPRQNIYAKHTTGKEPPPEPDSSVFDINLRSVYWTSYLALHYFRESPSGDKSLLMTSSAAGLYGSSAVATYTATKHGVIGLLRSIGTVYAKDGIRVNAICPGPVRTNLMEKAAWDIMPAEAFVPLSFLVQTVLQLIDGSEMTDAKGVKVGAGKAIGKAVELSADKFYFRDQVPFCDDNMVKCIDGVEQQKL